MTFNFYNDKNVQFIGIESCKSYNVGIFGGKVNNIRVVDLDSHKWDVKTHPWIITFGKALRKFDTYTVKTCSGGYHLYFLYDDDFAKTKNSSIGIDVLSNKTYIVAPHSHICNIKKNIIHKDYTVYHDTSIKPIPEDLKQFLFQHIYTSNSQKNEKTGRKYEVKPKKEFEYDEGDVHYNVSNKNIDSILDMLPNNIIDNFGDFFKFTTAMKGLN
eukprot:gene28255-34998_t